ncbi:DUF397 domain-containing protein [Actinomycetospora succinea]|uniref:DUF397 domain-containing protein n=1 Tax=Actinomycetospora succinea TaxID=663603 RepID=UPI00105CCBD7|nr:DUF397 domain-containing protein [Actinomycetospora succinea]
MSDAPQYVRSSFCAGGACVEVGLLPAGQVAVRDAKDHSGAPHVFTPHEWDAFIAGVKAGEFDRESL